MSINLTSIFCTIDTSEKSPERTSLIQSFIEANGGGVEYSALKECSTRKESLDYLFEGSFNGKDIDLAIEYKSFVDFSASWSELEDRLPRAMLAHKSVALIIEYPPTDLTELESTNCRFINPNVAEGKANVLSFAVFQAKLQEWTEQGIQVRLIQNTTQLTTTLMNLFYFVTKESHTGLWLRDTNYKTQYINWLAHLPIKGIGYSVAQKLADQFPNIHWLASYSESDIQNCVGKTTGTKIYNFFHDQSLRPDKDSTVIVPDLDKVMSDAKESIRIKPIEPKQSEVKVKVTPTKEKAVISNPEPPKKELSYLDETKFEYTEGKETLLSQHRTKPESSITIPIVEKTIEQKIIDEVSIMPKSDQYILKYIMSEDKLTMPIAHKKLKEILSTSRQLHMSQNMISFVGVKAIDEMEIGV